MINAPAASDEIIIPVQAIIWMRIPYWIHWNWCSQYEQLISQTFPYAVCC
ncbi:hypothetical protein ACTQ34_09440 [Agathobaculum sp. LCP25S3_E8]